MAGDAGQLIAVGKVVNTHGHRGEVRVLPLTDYPERFTRMERVYLEKRCRLEQHAIEKVYFHKKFVIVKFTGVDDMNAAEALKDALLMVTREELVPLPEDTYYIFDIIGLEVFTVEGRFLGRVQDVLQTGANDVYVVEGASPRPLLVPALKKVVRGVDMEHGKMIVELPEGLEE
ncbi:16S rRNA processing protein RimM [Desulfallas sp. Bu1-1]|uniref:ribosome maturation factor RimM n=1 Tax=Desulfallas sp. Bu1-1 TaxID=2787620 RepID=UPI0018A0EBD8|nr:ribosome maturation factor RimM [Desulfallas sp. Bu1-1]MBF7083596.1 16S rRNA processing protein RimM [Desulfallas sp. Bu1-1]